MKLSNVWTPDETVPATMDAIKTGHEKPVDRLAVRLLMRAPWWAQYPEPAKFAVREVRVEHSWGAWINYTAAPPRRPGGHLNQIKDLRGTRLLWRGGGVGTIIGYAHATAKTTQTRRTEKPPPGWNSANWDAKRLRSATLYTHYWWVVKDGEIRSINLDTAQRNFITESAKQNGVVLKPKKRWWHTARSGCCAKPLEKVGDENRVWFECVGCRRQATQKENRLGRVSVIDVLPNNLP